MFLFAEENSHKFVEIATQTIGFTELINSISNQVDNSVSSLHHVSTDPLSVLQQQPPQLKNGGLTEKSNELVTAPPTNNNKLVSSVSLTTTTSASGKSEFGKSEFKAPTDGDDSFVRQRNGNFIS